MQCCTKSETFTGKNRNQILFFFINFLNFLFKWMHKDGNNSVVNIMDDVDLNNYFAELLESDNNKMLRSVCIV